MLCSAYNNTEIREKTQEAQPARKNSSHGFIEAVNQW